MPTKKKPTTTRRRKITRPAAGRARKGERLLLTCSPLISEGSMEIIASSCFGMMVVDDYGGYWQVVGIRVEASHHKIYGKMQEMVEAAPYMFMPLLFLTPKELAI